MLTKILALKPLLLVSFCRLKFTSSAIYEVYISCDMFYVEVLLNGDGSTRDVRVEFAGESSTENVEPGQVSYGSTYISCKDCININVNAVNVIIRLYCNQKIIYLINQKNVFLHGLIVNLIFRIVEMIML